MSRAIRFRLSVMMFLEYMVSGATLPILSHYLKNYLGFEAHEVGYILSVLAIAGLISPFLASHLADRWVRSERLMALCHMMAAVCMVFLAHQRHFRPFLAGYFCYGLAFSPTLGLTNSIALHHMSDPRRDFGLVRMWGTAGWVAIAWVFSLVWLRGGGTAADRLPHALYASALSSVALAAYSLTLPQSVEIDRRPQSVMYWKSLRLLVRPDLAVLCVLTFAAGMAHQIYYYGMSPFLSQVGYPNHFIMPMMSIGQISEVITLGLLGLCLERLRIKQALVLGLAAQTLRYALFAWGGGMATILAGIGLHGICYAFYFTAAYIYIDQHSNAETRAGAQQLFTIVISGFGTFAAYFAGGYLAQFCTVPGTNQIGFTGFWLISAALSALVTLLLAALFVEKPAVEKVSLPPAAKV